MYFKGVSAEKVANKAQFDGSESSQTCSSFLDTLVKKIGNKMDLISDKLYSNGELVKAQAISEANQIYVSCQSKLILYW